MLVDMDVMFVAVSCLSTLQFEYIVTVLKNCVCVCVLVVAIPGCGESKEIGVLTVGLSLQSKVDLPSWFLLIMLTPSSVILQQSACALVVQGLSLCSTFTLRII